MEICMWVVHQGGRITSDIASDLVLVLELFLLAEGACPSLHGAAMVYWYWLMVLLTEGPLACDAGLLLLDWYWPALLLPEGTHPSACGCWLLLLLPEVTCPMASVSGLPLDWYLLVLLPEGTCTSTCGSRLLLDWNWLVLLAESTWLSMWYRRTPGLVLAGVVSPGYPPCGMWSRYAGLVILVLWWRLPKLPLIKCWLWH